MVVVVVRRGGGAVEVDEVLRAAAVEVLVDEVLDLDEAVDAAGDGDGALVAEAVLALGLLQQRAEERVLEVAKRDGEAALLLPLRAHPHRHAPLGRHRHHLLLLMLLLAVHDDGRQAGQIEKELLGWLLIKIQEEEAKLRGRLVARGRRKRRARGRSWRWRGGRR